MIKSIETMVTGTPGVAGHKIIHLQNGNKIHLKTQGQFGFWQLNYDKGQMPEDLKGSYTSVDEAMKAVRIYLEKKSA